MPIRELSDINASQGFAQLFVYVNDITLGLFSKLLLFALFIIITMGSYFVSSRTRGRGDFLSSAAVGGFVTATTGILMLSVDGLVSLTTVGITVFAEIVLVAWLLISGSSN